MRIWIGIFGLLAFFSLSAQKIYKTVDANGNVTYTDQPPNETAEPLDLPEISVIDGKTNGQGPTNLYQAPEPEEDEEGTGGGIYDDLRFTSPTSEENLWGTGGTVSASLSTKSGLLPEHRIRYYLDGKLTAVSSRLNMNFSEVFRGEHNLRAVIVDQSGRIMGRAGPIRFYIKQQSQQNPNSPANNRNNSG